MPFSIHQNVDHPLALYGAILFGIAPG